MTDEWSFLTNECQTLEGVDHSRNGQSKAHSFCFSRKLKPTSTAQESKQQVTSPNAPFRFALAGTNTIGIVCVLCKKNCEKGSFSRCHFRQNKAALSALLPFSHQLNLLAAVIQPLLLANSTRVPHCTCRRLVCACGNMLGFVSSTRTAHLLHA